MPSRVEETELEQPRAIEAVDAQRAAGGGRGGTGRHEADELGAGDLGAAGVRLRLDAGDDVGERGGLPVLDVHAHLLVLPERHVDSFREIGEFPPEEASRMLDFVADTARKAGLEDYRVVVNVGPGAGQTVFHLHWHILAD